jgi:hypothetical protein
MIFLGKAVPTLPDQAQGSRMIFLGKAVPTLPDHAQGRINSD